MRRATVNDTVTMVVAALVAMTLALWLAFS